MKTLRVVQILLLSAALAKAEDIRTISGITYTNAKITSTTPSSVTIMHSKGVATIPYSDLPDDVKAKHGYSAEKDSANRTAIAKQRAEAQVRNFMKSKAKYVAAQLSQVLTNGALAYPSELHTEVYTNIVTRRFEASTSSIYNPLHDNYTTVETTPSSSIESQVIETNSWYGAKWEEPVFITGIPDGYVDGDTWEGAIWFIGTIDYVTVQGAPKRVRKFTASYDEALTYYAQ